MVVCVPLLNNFKGCMTKYGGFAKEKANKGDKPPHGGSAKRPKQQQETEGFELLGRSAKKKDGTNIIEI